MTDLFGPGAAFHHVGVAVADIAAACPSLATTHDPIQRVRVGFLSVHGAVVELIEPAGEGSPVSASIAKGIKLVHLCFSVPNLEAAIAAGEGNGCRQVSEPAPAVAFEGRRIVWVFHPTYGLFELLEGAG
jgi:methylmalonyl-CoA/ethylmalonyl-CoA epimerase